MRPAVWQEPDGPLPSEVITAAYGDQPNWDKLSPQDSVPLATRLGATVPPASSPPLGWRNLPISQGGRKANWASYSYDVLQAVRPS